MEEGHLKHLCVVFDHFQEHNLRLKPTKCKFFWNEINYLAHHASKEGMQSSKENIKAVAEFAPPQTYMEIQAFLALVWHHPGVCTYCATLTLASIGERFP